jgi:hypothetical protein
MSPASLSFGSRPYFFGLPETTIDDVEQFIPKETASRRPFLCRQGEEPFKGEDLQASLLP